MAMPTASARTRTNSWTGRGSRRKSEMMRRGASDLWPRRRGMVATYGRCRPIANRGKGGRGLCHGGGLGLGDVTNGADEGGRVDGLGDVHVEAGGDGCDAVLLAGVGRERDKADSAAGGRR